MKTSKKIFGLLGVGLLLAAQSIHATAAVNEEGTAGTTDVNVTFEGGDISLVNVPDPINFESSTVSVDAVSLNGTISTAEFAESLQVDDARGTGAGWQVTAALSPFTDAVTAQETLQGSVLNFSAPTPTTNNTQTVAPTTNEFTLNSENSATPITANEGQGIGSWLFSWSGVEDNITLDVPAGVGSLGEHAATITWTLVAAPNE
ncbi:WxL domain-containing protein [Marinilactibacillus kalidii]|uniref:WxL domain-containing protein n=1 Tax=Marinilactibacillus kalidii TaxID=2820274 RepID=UPI001ABDF4DB|nr:WxL domain-containing protein [Marinilactibacillus kalidii]